MAISIGIIHGDAFVACSPVGEALDAIARMVGRRQKEDKPFVNVIFLTHGNLSSPNHEGAKVVRYAAEEKGIIVHVGLPKTIGGAGRQLRPIILQFLRDALEKAAAKFKSKDVPYDVERDLRMLDQLEAKLMANGNKN